MDAKQIIFSKELTIQDYSLVLGIDCVRNDMPGEIWIIKIELITIEYHTMNPLRQNPDETIQVQ